MYTLPKSRKEILARASRYKRALKKEKEEYGGCLDKSGKRYLIGPLYILADEPGKALEHYGWYATEFPDDVGEPIHFLYWALALHRSGRLSAANSKLVEAMVSNIYLLPLLFDSPLPLQDMWHASSEAHPHYFDEIPREFMSDISDTERLWIKEQFNSPRFRQVREKYISTYERLQYENDFEKRHLILDRWHNYLEEFLR